MATDVSQQTREAWRGRQRHASNTHSWLQRAKALIARWPKDGLSDRAIVDLVNALPTLARYKPDLFEASAKLLSAQSNDTAWQSAINRRLAIVRRAMDCGRPNLRGEALAFTARNDSWIGKKDPPGGSWHIQDGRSLDKFIQQGGSGRRLLWTELANTPGLTSVELPTKHLGQEAWAIAVIEVKQLLAADDPNIRQAIDSGKTWRLAVRRIKRLGVQGLFDPDTQTVIVDPRHPETLLHEVAHWVLGHDSLIGAERAEREADELLLALGGKAKT
jgi:hypothetical protein